MTSSNAEQIEYWNSKAGQTWVASQAGVDRMLEPLTALLLERADAQDGERVLDVGCGCGDTTLQIAQTGAAVWGIDISGPMLARAEERAKELGLDNVAFSQTDASTQALTPDHDLILSRFGVMFFADPTEAFRNLRSGLSPQGRLCFLCWQPPRANPWMSISGAAIMPFSTPPETPPDPRAPGPFAFADKDYVSQILGDAGFSEIDVRSVTADVHIADNLDDAVESQSRIGPMARALAELEGEKRDEAIAAAREALAAHVTDDGLDLGAACWLVYAR
ncbi:MAG: methyltransferase domain-containing protein [Myxococcota bacterium]|nr:methyltransferase domain-containing protein [Myxococcota bacterium]